MKKGLFQTALLCLLMASSGHGQPNPCEMHWGDWQLAIRTSSGALYFCVQYAKCTSTGICGWPKVGLKHSFPFQTSVVDVRLGGYDCSGQHMSQSFSATDLSENVDYKSGGNWHWFKSVTEVLAATITYHQGKDYIEVIYDKEKGINETRINGRTSAEIAREKQQEAEEVRQQAQSNAAKIATSGVTQNAYSTITNNAIKSNTTTNSAAQNQQKAYYQNQANAYLNSAQSGGQDEIMRSLNLGLAGINAQMSGNKAQAAQIQQLQAQQNAENIQNLTNSVVGLFQTISENKERERQRQEELRRQEEERREEERQRLAELARIKAEQDAAFGRFMNFFTPSTPEISDAYTEIYFVPAIISGSVVNVADEPIKIEKDMFDQWTDPDILKKFVLDENGINRPGTILAGFYKDKLSADEAIIDIQSILPNTGRQYNTLKFSFSEDAMNKFLAEEAVRKKRERERADRESNMVALKNSLPAYRYPNSLEKQSDIAFFIVGYSNEMEGIRLGMSNVFHLSKYSDGSWPLRLDVEKSISDQLKTLDFNKYIYVGYGEPAKIDTIYANLKTSLQSSGVPVSIFPLRFEKAKTPGLNKEFWNN